MKEYDMMDKKEVISFFDNWAEFWDDDMVKNQSKIDRILDIAEIKAGTVVLDVACGTGVLLPDYISRNVKKCVAIDISPKMIEIAKMKFCEYDNIEFLCIDAEKLDFEDDFDSVVIYNAFPHFVDRNALFESIHKVLKKNGRLTIAHGMSREDLIKHHENRADKVSTILPDVSEMAQLMQPFFDVDVKISTDEIYIVSGKKRKNGSS